ncbi:hypothetical protein WISP_00729 [Willisornis vidua]|uniref:Cytochrome b5 heme-binding domain-containing protein n=1 Tax=Willisornis vidua TaxID=1566151 RepID=A0ABQ9E0C9_9PASS|nr:hypothetical protein WISP_00729 [Willisornis vidua]
MWRCAALALLGLGLAALLGRGFEPRQRLLSARDLRRYRGAPGDPGLYLALLGRVFDVQRGRRHYGPGGAYSALAGTARAGGDITEWGGGSALAVCAGESSEGFTLCLGSSPPAVGAGNHLRDSPSDWGRLSLG